MTAQEKQVVISKIKDEANTAKHCLISLMYDLEEIGALRDAKSLGTIIGKLEIWQNK